MNAYSRLILYGPSQQGHRDLFPVGPVAYACQQSCESPTEMVKGIGLTLHGKPISELGYRYATPHSTQ